MKPIFSIKNPDILFRLVPILLAFCCFINTLNYGFVTDDFYLVLKAVPVLKDWSFANIKDLFVSDFWSFMTKHLSQGDRHGSAYYRPVVALFFMSSYIIADVSIWKWHLISILLHLLAVGFVYQLILFSLQKLNLVSEESHKYWLALIASSVFAIHPFQSESVAWTTGACATSLVMILSSVTLLAYLKTREFSLKSKGFIVWLLISSFFYTLAVFAKEVSLFIALALFCYEVMLLDQTLELSTRLKRAFIGAIPFVLITCGYLLIRILVFGAIVPQLGFTDTPEFQASARPSAIFTLPTIILIYLKNFIFPFFLAPMYPIKYVYSPGLWDFYLPAVLVIVFLLLVAFLAWRSLILRLAAIWLVLPILPSLNLSAFGPEGLVQDRYFYFSLIGGGIFLGQAFLLLNNWLVKSKNLNTQEPSFKMLSSTIAIMLAILAILMVTTITQNNIWKDEWEYFSACKRSCPDSCYANLELARLSVEKQAYSQAISYYEDAKINCPNAARLYKYLGVLYGQTGNLTKAEEAFHQLVKVSKSSNDKAEGYFNLGLVYEQRGDKLQATTFYQQALNFNPKLEKASQALRDLQ